MPRSFTNEGVRGLAHGDLIWKDRLLSPYRYLSDNFWLYRLFFKADIQNPVDKTKKSSARTLKFLEIFGSINVRTSRFPFVRSKVYSSLFTRTETKINDIWFWFPRNEPRSLKDILNFASTSTFQSSIRDGWMVHHGSDASILYFKKSSRV